MINIPHYDSVLTFNNIFFSKFANESIRRCVHIEDNVVVFKECLIERNAKTFERWLKDIKDGDVTTSSYTFKNVYNLLSRRNNVKRKNADLREFCSMDDFYLVKKYFTLGLITVPDTYYHIYATTTKSLDFFLPKREINKMDGTFEISTDYLYRKCILDKNYTYVLSPNTRYMFIAPHKCLFYFKEIMNLKEIFYDYLEEPSSEYGIY